MRKLTGLLLVCLAVFVACNRQLLYEFEPHISPKLVSRVKNRLDKLQVVSEQSPWTILSLHFGNTTTTRKYIPQSEIDVLAEESFIVRTVRESSTLFVVVDGKPFKSGVPGAPRPYGNLGLHYGIYHTLEKVLQFAYYHPFLPAVCFFKLSLHVDSYNNNYGPKL
jgi:hypothetical protein